MVYFPLNSLWDIEDILGKMGGIHSSATKMVDTPPGGFLHDRDTFFLLYGFLIILGLLLVGDYPLLS
jgi:hypothetical protein